MKPSSNILQKLRHPAISGIQMIACLCVLLQPLTVNSYWRVSGQVPDPPREFFLIDPETQSLTGVEANPWWTTDSDGDFMTNEEEVFFGSDPYRIDSDGDGLTDKDERDFSMTNPQKWDSDGDGATDYDQYYSAGPYINYNILWVYRSLRDADGDNIENINDPIMDNVDRDEDGIPNWLDPTPNGVGFMYENVWYNSPWADSDRDGIPDQADSTPLGTYQWEGQLYPNPFVDPDMDGLPNTPEGADPFPDVAGSYSWKGQIFPGLLSDNDSDNDSIPNQFDKFPDVQGQYEYKGKPYPGVFQDDDGDEIPNPADPYPNPGDEFVYEGQVYVTALFDNDRDGVPNAVDPYPNSGDGYWYPGPKYDGGTSQEYPSPKLDRDRDGIPDHAEMADWIDDPENGFDNDGDGISNYLERTLHFTNPERVDTDGDGLTDKEELFIFGTNPLLVKSDPNQIKSDFYEVVGGDSDADGIPDHIEEYYKRKGRPMNIHDSADAHGDLDGDGFSNLHAYLNGWDLLGNLGEFDSDGDGMTNAAEAAHPTLLNRWDFYDSIADSDNDGVLNFEEIHYDLNPSRATTHGTENDLDYLNRTSGLNWSRAVRVGDVDGDGMSDAWEHWYVLDVRSPADATGDPDEDHLVNLREFQTWRDPHLKDYNQEADSSTSSSGLIDTTLIPPAFIHREIPELTPGVASTPKSTVDYRITRMEDMAGDSVIVEVKKETPSNTGGFEGGTQVKVQVPIFCFPDAPEDPSPAGGGQTAATTCSCQHGTGGRFKRIPPNSEEYWIKIDDGMRFEELPSGADPAEFSRHVSYTDGTGWTLDDRVPCDTWDMESARYQAAGGSGSGVDDPAVSLNATLSMRIRIPSIWAGTRPLTIEDGCRITRVNSASAAPVETYEDLTIEVGQRVSSEVSEHVSQGQQVTLEFMAPGGAPSDPASSPLSVNDGAGSRYRKVGLNGMPLPDAKPQVQNENGESDEETYIDAFSSQLRHSVSDVYVTDPALLIPLMVKRDITSDAWNDRSGLRPEERVVEPFGPCWTSNLCSYILFDSGNSQRAPSAEVTDEMGVRQRFFFLRSAIWAHDSSESNDVKTQFNTFKVASQQWLAVNTPMMGFRAQLNTGIELHKKFGTSCYYEMIHPQLLHQVLSPDRIEHEGEIQLKTYARLTRVVDRYGNELHYQYPNAQSLIPSKIFDPVRPGHAVHIQQADGRVAKVQGPNGEVTEYLYEQSSGPTVVSTNAATALDKTMSMLTQVKKGRSIVKYAYTSNAVEEAYPTEKEGVAYTQYTQHYHTELASITNELNAVYAFEHVHNTEVQYFDGRKKRRQYGLPMILKRVTSPPLSSTDPAGVLTLTTDRKIEYNKGSLPPGFHTTFSWSLGADKREYRYDFSLPKEISLSGTLQTNPPRVNGNPDSISYVFARMSIKAPDLSSEIYEFNTTKNMALSKVTDRNGTVTQFKYDPLGFDDPIQEINALEHVKAFTYDKETSILSSTTDTRGVKTAYEIDPLGRRLKETVSDPSQKIPGGYSKVWTFDNALPGFIKSETWDNATPRQSADATLSVFPQITKSYTYDPPGSGPGWWRSVTETIDGTAAADGSGRVSTKTISDFSGNKRSVTDGRGLTTAFAYDERGRLIKVTHPDGSFKTLGYDAHGNLVLEVDETDVYRFHHYDAWNRRIRTTVDLNGNRRADPRYTTATTDAQGMRRYNGDLVTETSYNSMNLVVKEVDPHQVITEHTYDKIGRRTNTKIFARAASSSGGAQPAVLSQTSYAYKLAGVNGGLEAGSSIFDVSGFKPVQVTDARGGITKMTYDKLYRPVTVQRPDGGLVHSTYDKAGNLTSTCEPTTAAAPAKKDDPEGNLRLVKINSEVTHYTATTPVVKHLSYDALGQPIRVDFPDGQYSLTAYTFFGKPYRVRDESGLFTHQTYDAAGRSVKSILSHLETANESSDPVTLMAYDEVGNPVRVRDPLGHVTDTLYDARNRAVKIVSPEVSYHSSPGTAAARTRLVTTTAYDAAGRVISVTDPEGNITRKFYDAVGRPIATVDALDHTTTTEYDAAGRVTAVIQANGQRVSNTYDDLGRLIATVDGAGITNTFGYDAAGNRTRVTDGLNQSTTFEYDLLNRLTKQVFANGDDWIHAYNLVNKVSETDPLGRKIMHQYDIRNRLEKSYLSTNANFSRDPDYNDQGRLIKATELGVTVDKVVEYTYDKLGQVASEKSVGVTHTYLYDNAGNRTSTTYADGRTIITTFDALKRPEVITDDNGTPQDPTDNCMTRYGYDRAGRAVQMIAANGQATYNTYDELGRLTARVLYRSVNGMNPADRLASMTWTHDAVGNVITQTEHWFASGNQAERTRATAMSYDGANRLVSETITESGQAQVMTIYSYDAANNRTTKSVEVGPGLVPTGLETGHWSYTSNNVNQLLRVDKRATATGPIMGGAKYTYDANGNRVSKVIDGTAAVTARTTTYTWDTFNRLDMVDEPVSGTVRQKYDYTYDYRTRRTGVHKMAITGSPARHTAIVFSGGVSVAEYERATNTGITLTTVPLVKYGRGPDMGGGVGGLLSTVRNPVNASNVAVNPTVTTPATLRYNLSNGRGDIVAQSDASATLTWTASYEAYGKRTKETGQNKDKQRANTKDEDPTGLLNEGHRYRDIETGGWLSRDPAGFVDGPNLYAYVKQNPWTAFDPDGLWQLKVHGDMTNEASRNLGLDSTMGRHLWAGVMAPDIPDGPFQSAINYKFRREGTATVRTHHGDLQPWHFMGRTGQDTAQDVKDKAINFILKNVEIFRGSGGDVSREQRDAHLGAALHTIQDSFSASHVSRDPETGEIFRVQDYSYQNADRHKGADTDITSSAYKNAVNMSEGFLSAVLNGVAGPDGSRSQDPKHLREYLDKTVFPMSKDAVLHGSEPAFEKRSTDSKGFTGMDRKEAQSQGEEYFGKEPD